MTVLASQWLVAEFLCRQWGHCLLTLSLPQCQGGAQEHPEVEAEVGALEAHTEQPGVVGDCRSVLQRRFQRLLENKGQRAVLGAGHTEPLTSLFGGRTIRQPVTRGWEWGL